MLIILGISAVISVLRTTKSSVRPDFSPKPHSQIPDDSRHLYFPQIQHIKTYFFIISCPPLILVYIPDIPVSINNSLILPVCDHKISE